MTASYVLLQNLRRNPLRSALTAVAFALPMAIFVLAISLVATLSSLAALSERELRVAVRNKVTLTNPLPEGLRRKIEALDSTHERLVAVCGMRWFGGRVPDTQNTIQSLGADADTFPLVYAEVEMTGPDIEHWNRERRACVVGSALAETYHWEIGEKIALTSSVPPYVTLEFIVVKIMTVASRQNVMYFRRDYYAEALESAGLPAAGCNVFWIKCKSADALRSLQHDIDAAFANTPDETKTDDENAFFAGFVQASGNIPGLVQAIAMVVVFIIALISGNTMMMSFRERTRELAIFKAIGFRSGRIFRIVLAESVVLALTGSLLGIGLVTAIVQLVPMRGILLGPFPNPQVSLVGVIGSLMIAVVIGLLAGLWPAYQAVRLRTVDALRMS